MQIQMRLLTYIKKKIVLAIYLLSFYGAEMSRIYFGYVPPLQTLKAQKTQTLSSDKSPLDICQA